MTDRDPNIIHSGLSGPVKRDGITVDLQIYRLEDTPGWSLEVINANGTSIVWDDLFDTDDDAHNEFLATVASEGMKAFRDEAKVIPFRR